MQRREFLGASLAASIGVLAQPGAAASGALRSRIKGATTMDINGFRGQLITADDADYDTARAVWNGAVDRRPRLIARCRGTADVAAAVRFARDRELEMAIRGGGHNVA